GALSSPDARVVVHNVEFPEALDSRHDERPDILGVRDVHPLESALRPDGTGHFPALLLLHVGDNHPCAFADEQAGRCLAHAARAPGYHRDLAFESAHGSCPQTFGFGGIIGQPRWPRTRVSPPPAAAP